MAKANITAKKLLDWNQYQAKAPNDALASIYARVSHISQHSRDWYWSSIRAKRFISFGFRLLAFFLLFAGTALPIIAATLPGLEKRLLCTQIAVACLAGAGLTQVGDKIFGWSSGWMRYITTVTTMENLTRTFELAWARYVLEHGEHLNSTHVEALFDIAETLEQEILKLQAEETGKWVAEFNAGISLLDTLIKTQREETAKQREETEKKIETLRKEVSAQKAAAEPAQTKQGMAHSS